MLEVDGAVVDHLDVAAEQSEDGVALVVGEVAVERVGVEVDAEGVGGEVVVEDGAAGDPGDVPRLRVVDGQPAGMVGGQDFVPAEDDQVVVLGRDDVGFGFFDCLVAAEDAEVVAFGVVPDDDVGEVGQQGQDRLEVDVAAG